MNWFAQSVRREPGWEACHFGLVDFYKDTRLMDLFGLPLSWHVEPKPNPWQGKHRLTKEDWFAMSNARNTALCLCADPFICWIDDLSVVMPGWLAEVKKAQERQCVVLGAYRKVRHLMVENGEVKSYENYSTDSRLNGRPEGFNRVSGGMCYGCSLAMPVEVALSVNGWPEDLCDGLSFEDVCFGVALENAGHALYYSPGMLTLESEEEHHNQPPMKRSDYGRSPNDKSHAALDIARASKWFPNTYNVRQLREKVLAGEPFPLRQIPEHEWYTKTHLSELA